MPKPFPKEFRDDVIRVAENRDPDVTLAQIAKDFGVHVGTLDKWMRQARIEAGEQSGQTSSESAELRALRKRNGSAEALVESGVYAAKATASIIMVSNSTGVSFPSRRCRRLR